MSELENPVYQRLNFIVDSLESGNQAEFARRIGVRSGVVGDMFGKRRNKPSFEVLAKIAVAYPQLRVEWLLSGEGDMLKPDISDIHYSPANGDKVPRNGKGTVLAMDEPDVSLHPYLNKETIAASLPLGITNASRIPVDKLNLRVLPYLPIEARAGLAEFYADDLSKYPWENAETLAVLDVPDTSEYKEAIVVAINGDSMEPTIKNGSKVVVTPVQRGNWQYINSGVYCIIYNNNFVVKRVKDNTLLESGLLRLHSDNPTGGSFPVKGEDIRAVWRVRWAAYTPID